MKRCIINYAADKWYPLGQARLLQSLASVGWREAVFLFSETSDPSWPSHAEVPYGFKYWAMDRVRRMGYDLALWVDCSFFAVRSLDGLFADLERCGYLFQESFGYTVGDWTSDECLRKLGKTREEARKIVMHDGGLIGLNFHNEAANHFQAAMFDAMKIDGLFQGPWTNENHQASQDDGVCGHRHDMSVGSVIAHNHRMQYAGCAKYWCEKRLHEQYPNVCFLGEGM
jgi:hypothetical protein